MADEKPLIYPQASLSKLAKEITGTHWNGFLFWGLQRRSRSSQGRTEA